MASITVGRQAVGECAWVESAKRRSVRESLQEGEAALPSLSEPYLKTVPHIFSERRGELRLSYHVGAAVERELLGKPALQVGIRFSIARMCAQVVPHGQVIAPRQHAGHADVEIMRHVRFRVVEHLTALNAQLPRCEYRHDLCQTKARHGL